jgi:hypothetical protein
MDKVALNTFTGGLNQDLDKAVMPSNKYLDALNLRLITTEGGTTGSFENIKGTKFLIDGNNTTIGNGDFICGGVQLRDCIILFTTTYTGATPTTGDGDSKIWKMVINTESETQTSLTLLYNDALNVDDSDLCFSTANPIKAIAKYETPNVQKVYWTDGYNNLRYCNVSNNLTVTGDTYFVDGDYMSVDKFEFLPKFTNSKPVLKDIVGGKINTGLIAYAYQLYILNGAETAFSALSDPIHVVSDNDFLSDNRNYHGDETSINSGKGFVMEIDSTDNVGYNRLRMVRIHYSYLNSVPEIFIANEIQIDPNGSTVLVTDIGDILGTLTVDEFNLSSTELFKCQDIASKNNRLFAANIDKSDFILNDWDSRAVRFNSTSAKVHHYNSSQTTILHDDTEAWVTFSSIDNNTIGVVIADFDSNVAYGRDVTDVTNVEFNGDAIDTTIDGYYTDTHTEHVPFSSSVDITTVSNIVYTAGTDELSFYINKTSGNFFVDFSTLDVGSYVSDITFIYDWDESSSTYKADIYDTSAMSVPVSIATPYIAVSDDTSANWNAHGWSDYIEVHDGINKFNDPTNDGVASYQFIYQSDGTTLGAEGPNIKIDFETEEFILDSSNDDTTFYVTPPSDSNDLSFKNYASPWKDGKLSWQRDEVYRLSIVFGNDRGQLSDPQWICDLRMPSLHEATYGVLATIDGTDIKSTILYPRVYLKSFPSNASFAQIHRVKRERSDRSVVTQGFVTPSDYDGGSSIYYPEVDNQVIPASGRIIKIESPEINITKNISKQSNDYLEYVTNFSTVVPTVDSIDGYNRYVAKLKENDIVPFTTDTKTIINDAVMVSPAADGSSFITLDGKQYSNYRPSSKGCSGLLVSYYNTSWSAETVDFVIVNYKSDVYGSQYGGYTYEDRTTNVSIPCSDVIKDSDVDNWVDVSYGDTFINYFDVSTLLYDLVAADIGSSNSASLYIPLESSINCDLRHDTSSAHLTYLNTSASLRQEYSGIHTCDASVYNQDKNLYLYNTVYSQQMDIRPAFSVSDDKVMETKFDCMVKASNVKSNGELTDSWSKFGINEFIEVDSIYGPVNSIVNFNNRFFFLQDKATGILSINDRSVIQDTSSAKLVLGTGGVLDRYDYLSMVCGSKDKFSVVCSDSGLFWYDRINNYLIKFGEGIDKVSVSKGMQSYLNANVLQTQSVIAHPDLNNNEVLFTFFVAGADHSAVDAFTLAYSENVDAFTSFYSFIPNIYIPYNNRYLSTTRDKYCADDFDLDRLFLHDSNISNRCNFYSLADNDAECYYDSTLKMLFNQDYIYTKTWDNIYYMSNVYLAGDELYNKTLDSIRCYNDYQNTDWVTLTYNTNIRRRERSWTLDIPRNLVDADITDSADIFDSSNLSDPSRLFRERLRDKYMIMDVKYVNSADSDRFVLNNMGVNYRSSYR